MRAEGSRSGSDDEAAATRNADNIDECEETIAEMERRKNMRVAWVTGRHVQRVRVVDTVPTSFPDKVSFTSKMIADVQSSNVGDGFLM